DQRRSRGDGKPETFDFLGFTHICGRSRAGRFVVRRITIRTRLRTKLQKLKRELRARRHDGGPVLGQWVRRVVQGYFNYHAVPGNGASLERFRAPVTW